MEIWKTVRDLRVAAAMAIMDIPVKVTATVIAATGERRIMYHIATASVDKKFVSPRIYAAWKSGKLERTDPAHPFLTGMRGLENRRVLLDFLKNPSATFAPFRVGSYAIWQLVARAGCGLPGLPAAGEVFATSDLKISAALATAGFPPLKVEPGTDGRARIYHARHGIPRAAGEPLADAVALATAWRRDKRALPWEEPFLQAALALWARERIMDLRDNDMLLVRKPRSQRAAILSPDAGNAAWDKVKEHFDR